jgi:hypothetical protein
VLSSLSRAASDSDYCRIAFIIAITLVCSGLNPFIIIILDETYFQWLEENCPADADENQTTQDLMNDLLSEK